MASGDVPSRRDHDVKIDPVISPAVAVAKFVIATDARLLAGGAEVGVEDLPQQLLVARVLPIHQSRRRFIQQPDPHRRDVQRDQHGPDRIRPRPAGANPHDQQRDQHARAGDGVGEQVFSVGDERDRSAGSSGSDQIKPHPAVDHARQQDQPQADAHLMHARALDHLLDCAFDDDQRGDEDHAALESRGEELGLPVPVRMLLIGRLVRQIKRPRGHQGGDDVDDALQRIGKNGGGVRRVIGGELDHQQQDRHDDRKRGGVGLGAGDVAQAGKHRPVI